jgi:hypothetical protein
MSEPLSDKDYRAAMDLLMQDLRTATQEKDRDGALFALLQIFKLNHARHQIKPPTPEQVATALALIRQNEGGDSTEVSLRKLEARMKLVFKHFGEEPPQ